MYSSLITLTPGKREDRKASPGPGAVVAPRTGNSIAGVGFLASFSEGCEVGSLAYQSRVPTSNVIASSTGLEAETILEERDVNSRVAALPTTGK